jgi:tetratricopeptide (TPR) repeat protein
MIAQRGSSFSLFFLLVLTFIAYSSTFQNSFLLWDDNWLIYQNRWVTTSSFFSFFQIFNPFIDRTSLGSEYLPLPQGSYFLEYLFWEENPFGYHLTQILCYLLALVFCYYWLAEKESERFAWGCTALFALHPLHTESVTWLSGRKDVLALFFFFATLYAHEKRSFKNAYFLCFCAFLCKGTTIILVGCLWLWDRLHLKSFPKKFQPYGVYLLLTCAILILHLGMASQHGNLQTRPHFSVLFSEWGYSLLIYLRLLFFPVALMAHYQLPTTLPYWLGMSLALSLFGGTLLYSFSSWWSQRKLSLEAFFWFWFLGTLLPVSNLLFYRTSATIAERYLLLPSFAFCYFLMKKMEPLPSRFLSLILFCFFLLTFQRNREWETTETLWKKNLQLAPYNTLVLENLGKVYQEEGLTLLESKADPEKAQLAFSQARKYYERCLSYDPVATRVLYNLGLLSIESAKLEKNLKLQKEQFHQAQILFQKALKQNPQMPQALSALGTLAFLQGELERSRYYHHEALHYRPYFLPALLGLGNLALLQKEFSTAEDWYHRAFQEDPQRIQAHHYRLGLLYSEWCFFDPSKFQLAEFHLQQAPPLKATSELLRLYQKYWNFLMKKSPRSSDALQTLGQKLLQFLPLQDPSRLEIQKFLQNLK